LGSDLARVDGHVVRPSEYKELTELTDDMLARAVVKKGGRPRSANTRQLISLRLPPDVIARWRATGPGWQSRKVVHAGLRLLEEHEQKVKALRQALIEGENSGEPQPFDAAAFKQRMWAVHS
jgi:uncharacterized protein (DUF4415 family)